jgi:hypothetical protein
VSPSSRMPRLPLEWLQGELGFSGKAEALLWAIAGLTLVPASLILRFWFWANALLEPHPIRQTQTALTVYYMHKDAAGLLDYRSPLAGSLWNFVFEFPLYQWIVALGMDCGLSLETASRSVTLVFFLATGAVLVGFVYRFLGRRIAAWTGLLWLISPFNVIYSRVCLVDFTVLFFSLGSLGIFLEMVLDRRPFTWGRLALGAGLGVVAAVSKATIWFTPAGLQGILLVAAALRHGRISKRHFALAGGLALQLVAAVAWMRWANYLRSEGGILTTEEWIFGSFAKRLQWENWRAIGRYLFYSVFQAWMAVPFFVALLGLRKRHWPWTAGLLFLIAVPILVTFNVHSRHDYYLIGEVAYWLVLVAMGMVGLFSLPPQPAAVAWGIMAALFCWRLKNASTDFEPFRFDYRSQLTEAYALKDLTAPDDLVYYDTMIQDYQIPLYSERLVGLGGFGPERLKAGVPVEAAGNKPSVFRFQNDKPKPELLAPFDPIWVVGNRDFFLYRVEKRPKFRFDATQSIGVASRSHRLPDYRFDDTGTLRVKAREHSGGYLVVELLREGSTVHVKAMESGVSYAFPRRDFLFLPAPPTDEPETYEISLAP